MVTHADILRAMIRTERELLDILEGEVERAELLRIEVAEQRWRAERLTAMVDDMRAEARGGSEDE